jgi:hypothetical protein
LRPAAEGTPGNRRIRVPAVIGDTQIESATTEAAAVLAAGPGVLVDDAIAIIEKQIRRHRIDGTAQRHLRQQAFIATALVGRVEDGCDQRIVPTDFIRHFQRPSDVNQRRKIATIY